MLFCNEDLPEVSEVSMSDFMQAHFAFQKMSEEEILGFQLRKQEQNNHE